MTRARIDSPARSPGPVDRALRVFGDVRPVEGTTVVFVMLAIGVAWLLLREYRRLTAPAGAEARPTGVAPARESAS